MTLEQREKKNESFIPRVTLLILDRKVRGCKPCRSKVLARTETGVFREKNNECGLSCDPGERSRFEADSARALAVLRLKDRHIERLEDELAVVRGGVGGVGGDTAAEAAALEAASARRLALESERAARDADERCVARRRLPFSFKT